MTDFETKHYIIYILNYIPESFVIVIHRKTLLFESQLKKQVEKSLKQFQLNEHTLSKEFEMHAASQ